LLFTVVGMNVARCMQNKAGEWFLTSRELQLYLSPDTNRLLRSWNNPFTGDTVPVVHVANDPVQNVFAFSEIDGVVAGPTTTFVLDLPLFYPNPLYPDLKFHPYSPQRYYDAGEFFQFGVPTKDLRASDTNAIISDGELPTVTSLQISWHRLSPWLPWMKMGDSDGQLLFSALGSKVDDISQLPHVLQKVLDHVTPLYKNAAKCFLDAPNETSWTYFGEHFEAYLQGKEFPLPAIVEKAKCKQ